MNKREFIEQEIEKNKKAYGRWYSDKKRNSADHTKLLYESSPKNDEEALQHGNALANTGNYPLGTSACFNVGISGGCGPECFVYLRGECDEPQEMIERLEGDEEIERHYSLYPEKHECETCQGKGTIDCRIGGYSDSTPDATCPDCDGKGYRIYTE